ncbi:MAG: RsmB/NOP family class I SAM-dependent RNA methyltransferase, partial [Sphingobacteriales bacterium]
PTTKIYASDLRAGVLHNLEERQKLLGKGKVETFLCNLENKIDKKLPQFDGIVADVPCSGSGTWARNPENLSYFDSEVLPVFQQKQLKILENIYPFLKTGKPLVYITCSVFKAENEEVIEKFCAKHSVKIDEQKYLEGYKTGAENIFLCRLIKTE